MNPVSPRAISSGCIVCIFHVNALESARGVPYFASEAQKHGDAMESNTENRPKWRATEIPRLLDSDSLAHTDL